MSGQVAIAPQFGILGSLRITVDGREIALDSPKQRRLLAALLIDAGSVVSADRLADILWGGDQPGDPSAAVQTHVSRIRSLLGREGGTHVRDVLVTRPPGYALAVDPQQVDAARFERQVEQARSAPTPQAMAALLQEALELWRGPPLAEFDHELARTEATRLEELRTTAVELRADALLAMGRYAEVVAELEAAVARHPLREHLRGQLMVALVRNGRQADALATYRDLRDVLVDELGVEPSAALRRLERAILQQDDELPWPDPAASTAAGAGTRVRQQRAPSDLAAAGVPESLTSFVGREEDVRGVCAALAAARIVVLTGVGGVGKSRLAVRVARDLAEDYADGVDLCDLVGAGDSAAVSDVVATTLGVLPADGADSQDALVELLRPQRRLLVLDNCEHVLAGASELVDVVGRSCPQVDVLATSRQPLGVAGQQVWPVRPLEVGERGHGAAVELFRDRAMAVDPTFELDEADREVVGEICRHLDGLPLAVELAAARVRSMTPADIAARLDDRFALLTHEPRVASSRHRSLQAVVDWSYGLLAEPTRRLFERLGVFAGGFGIDAAERVCAGDGLEEREVAGRLTELVDHSLVAVDRSGRHARYRLLETLRTYARTRLEERDELSTWRCRHAEHFAALAGEVAAGLESSEQASWMRLVDTEFANLRAAHAWARDVGDVDVALRLPSRLRMYAYQGLHDEVYDWVLRALELPGATDHPARPTALVTAGVGWIQRGRLERARDLAEQVLVTDADEDVALRALRLLAEVALYQGRLEETDRRGRDVVERARAAGRPHDEAMGILYRVHAAAYSGRGEDARALLETGWQAVESTAIPTLRAGFWFLEGEVRLDAEPEAALDAFRRSIEIARATGDRFVEGVARVSAASLEARHGQADDALVAFREIIDHWRRSGDWAHMWTTLHNLLVLFERVGEDQSAAVLLGGIETAGTGAPAFGEDAARLETTAGSLRASLGEDAFPVARDRGRRMSDDEVVLHALDGIDRLVAVRGGPPAPGGPAPARPDGTG